VLIARGVPIYAITAFTSKIIELRGSVGRIKACEYSTNGIYTLALYERLYLFVMVVA
jgi:hypothetical protein